MLFLSADRHRKGKVIIMFTTFVKKVLATVFSILTLGMFGTANASFLAPPYITNCVDMNIRYTGAIIDCRNLDLSTAMSPVIVDTAGNKVYGNMFIDPDVVTQKGMVGYATCFADRDALSRAGDNPIILRAIAVRNGCNPVIDQADATLMKYSIISNNYFRDAAVVFVR